MWATLTLLRKSLRLNNSKKTLSSMKYYSEDCMKTFFLVSDSGASKIWEAVMLISLIYKQTI